MKITDSFSFASTATGISSDNGVLIKEEKKERKITSKA